MRPSLLVSLLLLSFLISEAQGIRLEKGFASVEHHKLHEGTVIRTSNGGVGGVILCKDGHCSGNSRKLMTETTSGTINTSKKDKNEVNRADPMSPGKSSSEQLSGKEENFTINSSPANGPPVTGQPESPPEHYPDILDIAGMDYSPAKRKPPIHN